MTGVKIHELLAESLAQAGVRDVFMVLGDGNLDFLDALARRGVRLVHARHEQGAVAMADGYARAGGGLGVCSVTHGAGLAQTATSLQNARAYGSPVLLVAGDLPVADPDRQQTFDQQEFGRLTAGAAWTLWSARALPAVLGRVGRRLGEGPVVLNVPTDVQREELDAAAVSPLAIPPRPEPSAPAPEAVERAIEALGAARRPVILAGRGAVQAGAGEALGRLADRLGAPLATTLLAHGLCAEHPRHVGVSGSLGDGRGTRAVREADCVLAVGSSLSRWTLGGRAPGGGLVQVDADPARLDGGLAAVGLLGDARVAAEHLLAGLGARADGAPGPVAARSRPDAFEDGPGTVDPRRALLALEDALPAGRRLVVDGGHNAIFALQLLSVHAPEQLLFTSNSGAIGQGLATALGAAMAAPQPRTTLVVGDGGFLMALAELETAARYGVPLTIFVVNDGGYGQELHNMRAKGLDPSHAAAPTPDLAALARSAGAAGRRIDSPAALASLPELLEASEGPLLLDVRVNPDVLNPSSAEIAAMMRAEP